MNHTLADDDDDDDEQLDYWISNRFVYLHEPVVDATTCKDSVKTHWLSLFPIIMHPKEVPTNSTSSDKL
jgi:hypothetical protein